MPLEIVAIALCVIALGAVVAMLSVAWIHIADPASYIRCHGCSRWMIDTIYRPRSLCFRCRHDRRDVHRLVARDATRP